jgi:hypothetical protein
MDNTDIDKITYHTFLAAVKEIKKQQITSRAPLGYSSSDIYLFGNNIFDRVSVVTVRNHSGMYSMLITNSSRDFLFSGKFGMELPFSTAAKGLYSAFKTVKHKIL